MIYSPTEEMIGNIITKPLPKMKFEYCRNLMHLSSIAKRGWNVRKILFFCSLWQSLLAIFRLENILCPSWNAVISQINAIIRRGIWKCWIHLFGFSIVNILFIGRKPVTKFFLYYSCFNSYSGQQNYSSICDNNCDFSLV